jgi:hypothetical protein
MRDRPLGGGAESCGSVRGALTVTFEGALQAAKSLPVITTGSLSRAAGLVGST